MGDPIGMYLKFNRAQVDYMQKNGIDPNDPIADKLIPRDLTQNYDYRNDTAIGRQQVESESQQGLQAQLEKSLKTATGTRKDNLQMRLDAIKKEQSPFSLGTGIVDKLDRLSGGVVEAPVQLGLGGLDLITGVGQLGENTIGKVLGVNTGNRYGKAREQIHESERLLSEASGAKGLEGIVGNFVGSMGFGALEQAASKIPVIGKAVSLLNAPADLYATASNATLKFLGKANVLQPAVRAAMQGGRLARAAGQVVGDLPLNTFQALTQPDANINDIAKSVALGAAGSLVGGGLKEQELYFPEGKPFDTDYKVLPDQPGYNPDFAAKADVVSNIKTWQNANPDKVWTDLSQQEQNAVLGTQGTDVAKPTNDKQYSWDRKLEEQHATLTQHAKVLSDYVLGNHDDVDAAQHAYQQLVLSGIDSQTLTSMMGMKAANVNGTAIIATPNGMTPDPQRLLLASGQAPKALLAAARADSYSHLDKPEIKVTDSGDSEYTWNLKNGDLLIARGQPVDGTFRTTFVGTTGKPPGIRTMLNAKQQIMDLTNTTDVAGLRISGANPDTRGMGQDGVSRPIRPVSQPGTTTGSPAEPERITPPPQQSGTTHPGVTPDNQSTLDVMKKVKTYQLDNQTRQYASDIANQLSDGQDHAHAEMAARFTTKQYEDLINSGSTPDEARTKIQSDLESHLADTSIDRASPKEQWQEAETKLDQLKPGTPEHAKAENQANQLYQQAEQAGEIKPEDLQKDPTTLVNNESIHINVAEQAVNGELTNAVRDPDGTIHTHPDKKQSHYGIIDYVTQGKGSTNLERGWITKDGDFISAKQVGDAYKTSGKQTPLDSVTAPLEAQPADTPPAEPSPAAAPIPTVPQELESTSHTVPIAQMGPNEVMGTIEKIMAPFNSNNKLLNTPAYAAAQRDIYKLNQRLKEIQGLPPESRFALDAPTDGKRLAQLAVQPLEKLNEKELGELNVLLQNANGKLPPGDPRKNAIVDKLMDLRALQRSREIKEVTPEIKPTATEADIRKFFYGEDEEPKKGLGNAGFTLPSAQAAIVALGTGSLLGYAMPADNKDDKIRNALIGAMVMGGIVAGGFYMKGKIQASMLESKVKLPGEAALDAVMVSRNGDAKHAELTQDKMVSNLLGAYERYYAKTLHPSQAGERLSRILALGADVGKHVGDMMATFGRWKLEANNWIYDGSKVQDGEGNWVPRTTTRADGTVAPVLPVSAILKSVDGDAGTLGKVAIAMTSIERYIKTGKMPHSKLDPIEVSNYLKAVDPKFTQAATAMRDIHAGLIDRQVEAGVVSHAARDAMLNEEYYTALERAFGDTTEASIGKDIANKVKQIFSPTGVKSRVGPNDIAIRNPVETLISNIPRVTKAVELNEKKAVMIALWESSNIPEEVKRAFMRPTTKTQNDRANDPQVQAQAKALSDHLPDLTSEQASAMVDAFDPTPLGKNSDKMTFLRDGKPEVWQLAPDLTETFQYMQGQEIAKIWQVLGVGSNFARKGTMLSPDFMGRLAMFDVLDSYMNSQHGGALRDAVPGLNWIDAVYKTWQKHPEVQLYGISSGTGTYLEGNPTPSMIIKRAQAQGDTHTAELWNHVKVGNFTEAYKTLLTPFAEAGRVSEYLAARRHGATVQESVRAATGVIGYYNQVGSYAAGMFHAVPFMKGMSQSTDQIIYSSGLHPFRLYDPEGAMSRKAMALRWGMKGIAAISIPTAIFYAANHGDEEIKQLRQTENGRRFWFFRMPLSQHIFAVRKFAGPASAIFGTGLEVALDKWQGEEPDAFGSWITAMRNELTPPFVPPILQAGYGIATGVDLSQGKMMNSGQPLPTDMQRTSGTSDVAGNISGAIVDKFGEPSSDIGSRLFSPSGIDFLVKTLGGTLSSDALRLADMSNNWLKDGHVPAVQEWPIVRKFVGIDMTTAQTRDMEDFYKMVTQAEKITNAMGKSQSNGDMEGFVSTVERYQSQIAPSHMILETRAKVSELQRAMAEIKSMPGMTNEQKRDYILTMRRQMQMLMGTAVQTARSMSM